MENREVWKSYVWYDEKCFFVSTIERDYDTYGGTCRGQETLVWEFDWEKSHKGKMIEQAGNICDHQAICRCLINYGYIPDNDEDNYLRFR